MTISFSGSVRHPKIYAYTTPVFATQTWTGGREGSGLIKVGCTDRDVRTRVQEQVQPVKTPTPAEYTLYLSESAVTNDGRSFFDHEVHRALVAAGVHRSHGEWFECTVDEVRAAIQHVKAGTEPTNLRPRVTFPMRPEQRDAVEKTAAYFTAHADEGHPPHFLWNAKMRFGKTFTTYQLAKRMKWTRVLVLTYKPATQKAWHDDLLTHADFIDDGWRFKGKDDPEPDADDPAPLVWFASFQDVLGTDGNGNVKPKNETLYLIAWDAVVIDEYHFGAWRDAARSLYEGGDSKERAAVDTPDLDDDFLADLEQTLDLTVRNYLYLSGTPFRALTEGEFLEDQVFNWTYGDEQGAKVKNPDLYAELPKMHLLAYEMPEKLREVAINEQSEFSLTEFFKTQAVSVSEQGSVVTFVHEAEVQKWLDLLRGQDIAGLWANVANQNRPPLPYEDLNLLAALQHTVWYLPNVNACIAMEGLLQAQHNTFYRDYTVIVAAGSRVGCGSKALPPVEAAIGAVPQDTKTITLTCGKLMTGVTVPAWAGIFMLRELKSPESYFQAAFRAQSPWTSRLINATEGGQTRVIHKENCYVLDFSPNRALQQIVDYATKLRSDVASERDTEAAVEEFMEFLPVLSFDGYSMSQVDASGVIDYLTRGVTSSMLARRWNSSELVTLNHVAMERLLADPALLGSLEQIEMFRGVTDDLSAMISSNKEIRKKKLSQTPLTNEEKATKKKATERRASLKERLRRFLTRIPAFMYLTNDREKTVREVIEQVEPDLFVRVTGLTLKDFKALVDAGVFHDAKMNDAVWKFRDFEEPSLHYTKGYVRPRNTGGWNEVRSDEAIPADDGGLEMCATAQRGILGP